MHSMVPKIEKYTEKPESSANKAKTKSLTRMPTTEKAMKKRDCTQMPVQKKKEQTTNTCGKKERPNHKCWWQTKKWLP